MDLAWASTKGLNSQGKKHCWHQKVDFNRCVCAVEAMFAAVSDCQVLHPDPEDIDSEDEAFADYEELEEDAQENGQFVTAA